MGEINSENSDKKQIDKPWLFQKGQSGNPAGKPKGTLSLTTELKRQLQEEVEIQLSNGEKTKKKKSELFISILIKKAIEDKDFNFVKLAMNYVDGLPRQGIDMDVTTNGESFNLKNDEQMTILATKVREESIKELKKPRLDK